MFIADDTPTLSIKLRRSRMVPSAVGACSYVHAAPTELGRICSRGRSINMALLPELEPKAAWCAQHFCAHPRTGRFFRALLASLLWFVTAGISLGGGWYVGNTSPGEWIQFTNVWLTAGSYRFTANAGSPSAGATMHLEVDGTVTTPGVVVPNTGRTDSFSPVHLGVTNLSQGYHTLRIVFETAGTSLDWFILRKDSDPSGVVKPSDTVMVRPSTSGMLIAPIVSFNQGSQHNSLFTADDASSSFGAYPQRATNGLPYSDYQERSWYRAPMFQDFDRRTDRFWDIMVDQLMASRAQLPLIHCRSTADLTHDLQDRAYIVGNGAFEGRWLQKLVEAVQRNPQAASSLQIGMFFEDGPLASDYNSRFGSYPSWGSTNLADYVMQYWWSPWFDQVPRTMLYQPSAGRPVINIWTAHPTGMTNNPALDGGMATFLTNMRNRMLAKYGLNPLFVVSPDADANTQAAAWGVAPWYSWGQSLYNSRVFLDGSRWGFSSCGSRYRLDLVWANDWDPVSNTGTPSGGSPGQDYFQSPLDTNGNSTLLNFYGQASAAGTKFIQEEGFYNIPEGSPVFASYAPGWNFPNQHLAAMRQYADPTTDSLMFEAEDCDQYYKTSVHENLGGSYRRHWYSPTGLDVYRPLHNLNTWTNKNTGPGNLVDLSAGFFDVWALDSAGQVWAHCISDGAPDTWTPSSMNGIAKFTCLAVGKHHAWAINGTSVYTCQLSYSQATQNHGTWTGVSGPMVQLSVNEADVWAVDAGGSLYRRRVNEVNNPAAGWTSVLGPGTPMNRIYAGGNGQFVWGLSGTNIYYSPTTNVTWTLVSNSNNITNLTIGSEEVWGLNAAGNIFRRNIAGVGGWETVDGNLTRLAVGENYAWGLSGSTPKSRRLTGFLNAPLPAIPQAPGGLTATSALARATVSWTPLLGAAGYNVKRATLVSGPYTVVALGTTNTVTDTGLADGTQYFYVVTAFNSVGESPNSNPVSVVTPIPAIPQAPTGLAATAAIGQVSLNWNASSDAANYKLKRATILGGSYSTIADVATNSAVDATVANGTRYYYVVTATNSMGESPASSPVTVMTPAFLSPSRPVTASSSQAGNEATNANDGNMTSRWAANGPVFPSWWRVDLGSNCPLGTVLIYWYSAASRYYQYRIEVSTNDVNYLTVVDKTGNTSMSNSSDTFSSTGRYVRITVTFCSQPGGYPSFHECLVYGASTPAISLAPANIATARSGNNLALSWPSDHLGWHLQVQTNAPGTGLTTNWLALPGSDLITTTNIPINPAKGAVFYRLAYP